MTTNLVSKRSSVQISTGSFWRQREISFGRDGYKVNHAIVERVPVGKTIRNNNNTNKIKKKNTYVTNCKVYIYIYIYFTAKQTNKNSKKQYINNMKNKQLKFPYHILLTPWLSAKGIRNRFKYAVKFRCTLEHANGRT